MNSNRSRDLNELKKQALNYYSMNGDIAKRIEDALNSLFYDSPYDVYGYLSEYFVKFSKPLFITKVHANKSLFYDSKGQQTINLEIFCHEKNKELKILSLNAPCYSIELIHDSSKIQHIQEDDTYRTAKLNSVIHFINTEINDSVKNFSPLDQEELDEKLNKLFQTKKDHAYQIYLSGLCSSEKSHSTLDKEEGGKKSKTPTSPKQKTTKQTAPRKSSQTMTNPSMGALGDELNAHFVSNFYGSFVQSLISKALCMAASEITKKHLFEHVAELSLNNQSKYLMPTPLVTIIQNGKGFNGKQTLIKEFILMPKPNLNFFEGVELISKVNRFIRDTLYQNKTQPGAVNKCVTDSGAFTVTLETPQQGLDMIESAIANACGPDLATKIKLAVNIGANEIFDHEKNKYEVFVGGLKSSDEMIDIYIDLVNKYPRIAMIIEPFSKTEPLAWFKLYSRISKHCLIANTLKINDLNEAKQHEDNADEEIKQIEKLDADGKTDSSKLPDQLKLPDSIKPSTPIIMPVTFFKYENSANVTSLINKIKDNDDKKLYHGLSCSSNETDDSFLSDLAVGNQVSFIKIGGIQRSERVKKINRLIEIESYLKEKNILINPKERSEEFVLPTDLEIPAEFVETIHTYMTNIEEAKTKTTKK